MIREGFDLSQEIERYVRNLTHDIRHPKKRREIAREYKVQTLLCVAHNGDGLPH